MRCRAMAHMERDFMDFTVEGRVFRASAVEAQVLVIADGQVMAQEQVIPLADASQGLRLPRGEKRWQLISLRFEQGTEAQLPLPAGYELATGDRLTLGCLGPVDAAEGNPAAVQEVYAVSNTTAGWQHEYMDAATLMKRCGLTRVTEYELETYPLKKVCKVSAIVFLVGVVCFSFLMHLFTESMDDLVRRLPEALYMSAKFGGIAALVVAAGGGLYMKSSNDYNRKKKQDIYTRQFERAMREALPLVSA